MLTDASDLVVCLCENQTTRLKYRIRNCNDYNIALTRRGSLTLWIDQPLIDSWLNAAKSGRRGSSIKYADSAIFALLAIGQLFHLPLRQTQGFASSVFHLLNISLPVPDYSTLCRRSSTLKVKLASKPDSNIKHLLVDSSGLKVFGEGEWKVRTHGKDKRRTWRKLHISMDGESLLITAAVVTDNKTLDRKALAQLLEETQGEIELVCADGAYDTTGCYKAIKQRGASGVIPPKSNPVIGGKKWFEDRDDHLRKIQETDLKQWKKQSEYHRRSLVENAFYRLKTIFTEKLRSRTEDRQATEALIRCAVMNRMTGLGMPDSYVID
jgi:transposase